MYLIPIIEYFVIVSCCGVNVCYNVLILLLQSKGGILAKACDYIVELRGTNERLLGFVKENQQLLSDVQSLGRQCEELRRENEQLRNALTEHGIPQPL